MSDAAVEEPAPPWSRSVDVLNHVVGSRVGTTVRILRAQIRAFTANFPEWRLNRANREEWVERTAFLLVLGLISGRCGCGHHVRSCRLRQVRCECCVRGHALRSWVPGEMSLGEFVSIAVHSSPELRGAVWGDVFGRSMLRPVLDRAGLEPLVIGDAEVRRCAACVPGLVGSLWSLGPEAHVHSGRFDELAQLQLAGVDARMDYDLRIMGERHARSVHDFVAASAPVTVRNPAGDAEPVTLLVVSDQDGRTVTIRRTGGDTVVAEVEGLGIIDRRMVARLPIRTSGQLRLLAPLRWNYRTDRCEARLRLLDSHVVVGDVPLEISRPDDLEPELADNVTASIPRADPDTASVWTALAAEPGLHQRITTAIRTAPRGDW